MLRQWIMLLGIGLLLCAQGIEATQIVRRFVLAVGANDGGAKRETLQYVVSDARRQTRFWKVERIAFLRQRLRF